MNFFGGASWRRMRTTLRTREALRISSGFGGVLMPALRIGLSYLVPILALACTGRTELAPFAALGAFTSLYCRVDPYSRRARLLPVVALGLTASVTVGALTAAADLGGLAKVVALTLVATGAKLLSDVLRLGPPGGLMFVFAAGAAAYAPASWSSFGQVVTVTAASAAVSFAFSAAGALLHPTGPHRLAAARALLATADHLESPGAERRHRAHAAVHHALAGLRRRPGRTAHRLRGQLALAVHLLHRSVREPDLSAEGARLRALARRLRRSRVPAPTGTVPAPAAAPRRRRQLREVLAPYRSNAVRMAAASLITGLLVSTFQIEHAYWAVVSVSSVLQSHNTTTSWHRALQRCAGTAAGALLALVIFAAHPQATTLLVIIVACQVAAELVVLANYGLALTFATPLALCLAALNNPDHWQLVTERVGTTVLGALLAVAVCAVLINRRSLDRLDEAIARCSRDTETLRANPADAAARTELLGSVLALRDAHQVAAGEFHRRVDTDRVLDAEHAAYVLLAETATAAQPVAA